MTFKVMSKWGVGKKIMSTHDWPDKAAKMQTCRVCGKSKTLMRRLLITCEGAGVDEV